MANPQKPGSSAEKSGQYYAVGPRGGRVSPQEITAVQGKPLPPTPKSGQSWVLGDATKHKR